MSTNAAQVPDQTPPFKDAAIAFVRSHAAELRERGVTGVWMFGSVARGDDDEESDLDLAMSTTAKGMAGVMVRGRIADKFAELVGRPVEVVRYPLQPHVQRTTRDHLTRIL